MRPVFVLSSFDHLKPQDLRFLQEAARLGSVNALLLSDGLTKSLQAPAPQFPLAERRYFLEAVRYVDQVTVIEDPLAADTLPANLLPALASGERPVWAIQQSEDNNQKRSFCDNHNLECVVMQPDALAGYPATDSSETGSASAGRPKVIVTGCYDWFHSGHVRFFEEVSELGDLYVVVGHDGNIRLLKGEGHPMYGQDERRYMAGSIRFVKQALVSTGNGWLDAEPEIERVQPDIYAVNEDGDHPEKRNYCNAHGIEYRVLTRTPKKGLPTRSSTDLRGF